MTNRYSDNWVTFRSETIARTEGLRAAHVGHHMAFDQAVETGVIAAEDLIREWRHKRRTRWRAWRSTAVTSSIMNRRGRGRVDGDQSRATPPARLGARSRIRTESPCKPPMESTTRLVDRLLCRKPNCCNGSAADFRSRPGAGIEAIRFASE